MGVLVIDQVVEDGGQLDVGGVSEGDQFGEADPLADRPFDDRCGERAGLGDQGDASRDRHVGGEGGVEPAAGDLEAQAVRADQAHPRLPADLDDAVLHGPALGADLAESGGHADDALDAGLGALLDDVEDADRRHAQDRQVGCLGSLVDAREGGDAADRLVLGVDRVDHPVEVSVQQVPDHHVAQVGGLGARSDNRHSVRGEQTIQFATHLLGPPCRSVFSGLMGACRQHRSIRLSGRFARLHVIGPTI
ncbi:MAG: hypothetical protein LKI24_02660 [Acidipropionibacterium sp.]|nr:hypothetical protein [Acidipropionibacterium sp.]